MTGTQSSQNDSDASVSHKNPKGAGRPPRDGGTVPTTLRLTARERKALAVLGDGDMTAGLRAALATLSRS